MHAGIGGDGGVELPGGRGERLVGGRDHGAAPQRVVVGDEAPDPDQLQQPLVVVEEVHLVRVHEGEVEPALVPLLQDRQKIAAAAGVISLRRNNICTWMDGCGSAV